MASKTNEALCRTNNLKIQPRRNQSNLGRTQNGSQKTSQGHKIPQYSGAFECIPAYSRGFWRSLACSGVMHSSVL